MEDIKQYLTAENVCVRHITEFLLYNDFRTTLPAFSEEARALGYEVPTEKLAKKEHIRREDVQLLISLYQQVEHVNFFKAWKQLVPLCIQDLPEYKKLTFYLHVHYAIIPFRTPRPILKVEHEPKDKIYVSVDSNNVNTKDMSNVEDCTPEIVCDVKESYNPLLEYDTDSLDQSQVFIEYESQQEINNAIRNTTNDNPDDMLHRNTTNDNTDSTLHSNTTNDNTDDIIHRNTITDNTDNTLHSNTANDNTDSILHSNTINDNTNSTLHSNTTNDNTDSTLHTNTTNDNTDSTLHSNTTNDNTISTLHSNTTNDNTDSTLHTNTTNDNTDSTLHRSTTNDNTDSTLHRSTTNDNTDSTLHSNTINDQTVNVLYGNTTIKNKVNAVDENTNNDNTEINMESAMESLKTFLATEGPNFSSQQDFLPFFALPFVCNPTEHPSFINLFQDDWLNKLNDQFYNFIREYSCGCTVAPKIVKLVENGLKGNPNKSANESYHHVHTDIMRRYKQSRRRFSKLHRDHQSLIGVAAELTGALESSVRGQAVDLRATLTNCTKIFPELFGNKSSASLEESDNKILISIPVAEVEPLRNPKVLCCSELDVLKIKSHLSSGSVKTKLLLLQALRWRITQGSGEERDQVVTWLSRHDILGVQNDLMTSLLKPPHVCTPHPLQQAVARLLNTVGSLRAGREYLASSEPLLSLLISTLLNIRLDVITSDMLLATLQKLSLRKNHRMFMIERGIVEWLIEKLSGECERVYTLEYSTALLMNLCLHSEARDRCATSVLKLLTDLLDTKHIQIMPVVAGTLYCLLSQERFNQAAKEMDMSSILKAHLERHSQEPQIQRQIETLMKVHRGDLPGECVQAVCEEPSEDELDDPDSLEAELDADDPVRAMADDPSGEILLQKLYRRIFPAPGIVCPNSARTDSEIRIIPTTPRSRPPTREK